MTHGSDERDPLQDWLDHQVQPLAPPPGTFSLITRRTRRRKLGKLAVTVTSAGAVAAAAAFAVPAVASLRAAPASSGSPLADAGAARPSLSEAAPGTSAAGTSAAPGGGPSAYAASSQPQDPYPAGGPVPASFLPSAATFISPGTGWVLGQAGVPGHCAAKADPAICQSVALTLDGGQSWRGVPAPMSNGLSGIRFSGGKDGWAYGPELWSTHDRGASWQPVNTSGKDVIALEAAGSQALAVFASCSAPAPKATPSPTATPVASSGMPAPADCTSFQLERSPAGTDHWTPVPLAGGGAVTLTASAGAAATFPVLLLAGGQGWLAGPDGHLFTGSLASGGWRQQPATPCGSDPGAPGAIALLARALTSGPLTLACGPATAPALYQASDGGLTWSQAGTAPKAGTVTGLAASPAAPAILATTSGIEVLTAAAGQWRPALTLAGGFRYVAMTTATEGIAVPANAALHEIWRTINGGLNWTPYQVK